MKTKQISRQRRWQLRQQENGNCIICGQKAVTATHCIKHAMYARERMRKVKGCKRRNNSLSYRIKKNETSK